MVSGEKGIYVQKKSNLKQFNIITQHNKMWTNEGVWWLSLGYVYVYIYVYTHTHTHTHTRIDRQIDIRMTQE